MICVYFHCIEKYLSPMIALNISVIATIIFLGSCLRMVAVIRSYPGAFLLFKMISSLALFAVKCFIGGDS